MNNYNYNHCDFVQHNGSQLVLVEEQLDIFYTDPIPRQKWQLLNTLGPYNELKKLVIDIETAGLDRNGTKKSSKLCSMKITAIHGIKQPAAWAIARRDRRCYGIDSVKVQGLSKNFL